MRGGQRRQPGLTQQKEPRTQARVQGEEKGIGRPVEREREREEDKERTKVKTASCPRVLHSTFPEMRISTVTEFFLMFCFLRVMFVTLAVEDAGRSTDMS